MKKNMSSKLKSFYRDIRNSWKSFNAANDEQYQLNFCAAELIRNTHSIEKGLSIDNPRLGFGHIKQKEMMSQIDRLQKERNPYYNQVCDMGMFALQEYLDYHRLRNYSDDFCKEIESFLEVHFKNETEKKGGVVSITREDLTFDIPTIESFINSRHSIRDFESSDVDDSILRKALILAQRAPSACNRQGYRAYVLSREKSMELAKSLPGIGGFADQVARFILITGKKSSYRSSENYQYIVSASIYAAYLSLTLHLYGLGACVVQRPVISTKEWENNRAMLNIDSDEQLVLMLAVGNLKESFTVPYSYRFSSESVIEFIE